MGKLLYALGAILLLLWIVGFVITKIVSPLIHLLLVIAVVVLAYQFITGRRRV